MALKLKTIIGSTRPGRVGPTVAAWVDKVAKAHPAFDAELVDLADFDLPLLDEPKHPMMQDYTKEHTRRWSAAMDEADAYVFVTPEYDYFPPATLINALQALALEWRYKPASVVSYGGVSGGLRASQSLRAMLGNVGIAAIQQAVPVPFVSNSIEDGVLKTNEPMDKGATQMLDELAKWAGALKTIRQP
ncbi:MAG: NADPH-dependent FMN reductase [Acuticoccus sp.]